MASGTVQPILTIGDPRLEQKCAPADLQDSRLAQQLADLHATLADFRKRKGFGRAIAAPQIGVDARMIAVNLGAGPISILNPEIIWRSPDEFLVWDDCLSVPDRIVRVKRARSIHLRYRDEQGRERTWKHLPEDLSELLQHEVDHLDGILMMARACGEDAVRPIADHAQLVAGHRPQHRLRLDAIARAASSIDPLFRSTSQFESDSLNRSLGCRVRLKVETVNPIGCFKGRGADFFLQESAARLRGRKLICASAGNWGQAVAYVGRRRGWPVTVYAATTANPLKLERMREFGAEVVLEGEDFDAAKLAAREAAARSGAYLLEDGRDREITEGAGSIAVELLADQPALDAVFVPLGNGAMLNGIARWVKAASPATRVIGVSAEGAPAMKQSFDSGRCVQLTSIATIADGIGVRVPVPEAVEDMKGLVDEVRLVSDEDLIEAMRTIYSHTRLLAEPSGAAGIAAIRKAGKEIAGQRVATVLCGANLTDDQIRKWIV